MSALAQSAKRVFDRLGTPVVYKRTTQGAFDPVSGTYGPGETAEYPITVSPPSRYSLEYVDGSLVQRGDVQVSIAAPSLPFAPALSGSDTQDAIALGGKTYNIISVEADYAGDTVAVYQLQVRA